jgi:hypothetical protein
MPPAGSRAAAARKGPRCRRCNKPIRVPPGWSPGAATRRHYWRKHREVMMGCSEKTTAR